MTTNIYKAPFKTCTMCQARWNTCQQFVEDHSLKLNGYFADFEDPREGLIMVTHHAEGCGSTICVQAKDLEHMYSGPKYTGSKLGNPECAGNCSMETDFSPCSAECDMRWIRDVMQLIKKHHYPTNHLKQKKQL